MGAAASDFLTPYADVQYGYLDAELGIENLYDLAAAGDYHRVRSCMKKGMDPNAAQFDEDDEFERGDTPMICAARGHLLNKNRPRHAKTLHVLLSFGGDVNLPNVLEQTPLGIACERNLLLVATWLVTHGADVNRANKAGETPLLLANRHGNADLVLLLLEHGARVIEPNKQFCCLKFPSLQHERQHPVAMTLATIGRSKSRRQRSGETAQSQLQQAFAQHGDAQQATRKVLLKAMQERAGIEEQRVFRAGLALDNSRKRQQRRAARARVAYSKYVAKLEQKRLELLDPLRCPGISNANADADADAANAPATTATLPKLRSQSATLLAGSSEPRQLEWNIATTVANGAKSRQGRPAWIAREVAIGSTAKPLHQQQTQRSDRCNQSESSTNALQVDEDEVLATSERLMARLRRASADRARLRHDESDGVLPAAQFAASQLDGSIGTAETPRRA